MKSQRVSFRWISISSQRPDSAACQVFRLLQGPGSSWCTNAPPNEKSLVSACIQNILDAREAQKVIRKGPHQNKYLEI